MRLSNNLFSDDGDLQFHWKHYPWKLVGEQIPELNKERITSLFEDSSAIMESLGSYLAKECQSKVADLGEERPDLNNGDVIEAPTVKKIFQDLSELGAMSASVSEKWNGLGMPLILGHGITQLLTRLDISLGNIFAYYVGSVKILEQFHGDIDTSEAIKSVGSGKSFGAMSLTESDAGSDLAKIRTKAEKQDDGSWSLTGEKIWITCGHAEHHIVLARTGSFESGLTGLSLFYVPSTHKGKKNLSITGLEEKVGHHPVVTATIQYDNSHAELLGPEGKGFSLMLDVMNHARVATASISLGACEAVTRVAEDFAQQRITMGKPINQHPMIEEMLEDMQSSVKALRSLIFECIFHEDMEFRYKLLLKEKKSKKYSTLLKNHTKKMRFLTPLVKYWGTEELVRISRMAIQIMGGAGYMKEIGLGRFHQDSLLLPIYEGTSQIQSLMTLKDRLTEVFKSPSSFVRDVAKIKYAKLNESDKLIKQQYMLKDNYHQAIKIIIKESLSEKIKGSSGGIFNLSKHLKSDWDPKKDLMFGQKHAERFTKITTYMEAGQCLIDAVNKAKTKEEKATRKDITQSFMKHYIIRSRNVLEEINYDSTSVVKSVFSNNLNKVKQKKNQQVVEASL